MKEQIAQIKRELEQAPFLFGGPEERSIIKRLVQIAEDQRLRIRELEKRHEEGEG